MDEVARQDFFMTIDCESPKALELYCPSLLILTRDAETEEFRNALENFFINLLTYEKSRLVRKTAAFALKTNFLPADNAHVCEYFVMLSSLEEKQVHFIYPPRLTSYFSFKLLSPFLISW
jgi:hypothetical protein